MPQISSSRRRFAIAVAPSLVLASLLLAACGSSSTSSTSTSTAANSAAAPPGGTTGRGGGRFTAIRECLQKDGITLPKRKPGQRGSGGFLGGAGAALPAGVSRAKYLEDIKKCGGASFGAGGGRFQTPAFKAALTKFAACMRENGVNVPAPNSSGKGPIFSTKGLNTASATFKTAETKCMADLRGVFLRRGSPSGGPPAGAPPGAGGGEAPSGSG